MDFRTILATAKKPLSDYALFAAEGIDHICNTYGPRKCGGDAEKLAQDYLVNTLKPFADSVARETFDVHPDAFMAFVPIAGGLLLASTAANIAGALKKNKLRAAYYNFYTDQRWGDAATYDLCINATSLGTSGTASLVVKYINTVLEKSQKMQN